MVVVCECVGKEMRNSLVQNYLLSFVTCLISIEKNRLSESYNVNMHVHHPSNIVLAQAVVPESLKGEITIKLFHE